MDIRKKLPLYCKACLIVSVALLQACGSSGSSSKDVDVDVEALEADAVFDAATTSPISTTSPIEIESGSISISSVSPDPIDFGSGFIAIDPPADFNNTGSVFTISQVSPLAPDNNQLQTGYFLDSAVEGLTYSRSDGDTGKTASDGSFDYYPGDMVEFSIGNVILGRIVTPQFTSFTLGSFNVTPLTLTPEAIDKDDSTVVNKLIFLQTLDVDGDPENGIQLTADIHNEAFAVVVDFSLPIDEFVNGAFATLIETLNENQLFSANTPRVICGEIDVLRHFGDLKSDFSFGDNISTYKSWWLETDSCTGIRASQITIKNSSVTFCPNLTGFDGCYDGVIRANGDILLPEMEANTGCANIIDGNVIFISESGETIPFVPEGCSGVELSVLQANLNYLDEELTGSYEASCNAALNDKQIVLADFIKTKQEGVLSSNGGLYVGLSDTEEDVDDIISQGRCDADSDCNVLALKGDFYCSLPVYKAYAPLSTDSEALRLKQHIYTEIKDEIEYSQNVGGTPLCFIHREPEVSCQQNICRFEDGTSSTFGF